MRNHILASDLLAKLSKEVDGAELYEHRSRELPVRFRGGALESVKDVEARGRALRIIKDGRLGFTTTTDVSDGSVFVNNALESAHFGDLVSFTFPTQQSSHNVQCFDAEVEQLDEGNLVSLAEGVVARIKAYDPSLQIEISSDRTIEEFQLLNTNGLELEDQRTSFGISVRVTRTQDDDILRIYDSAYSRRKQDVDGTMIADRIVQRLKWAERTARTQSKAMPVVFTPRGTVVLLLPLMYGLNGRYAHLGASPLSDKLDQQAFDRRFSIIDDGRLDFTIRSSAYDDEGIPTAEKPLIERGTVRQFLYDLKTAAQANARSTGNGFKIEGLHGRSFRWPPDVAPSSWLIPAGDQSVEAILHDQDEALLVEDVIGLGQGNVIAGEFSNNVAIGYLIQRGEIVGRVKNTMIAGNVYELLKERLIALSDRPEWFAGWLRVPTIAVDGVGVVSRE
jgi:PmbA protein